MGARANIPTRTHARQHQQPYVWEENLVEIAFASSNLAKNFGFSNPFFNLLLLLFSTLNYQAPYHHHRHRYDHWIFRFLV